MTNGIMINNISNEKVIKYLGYKSIKADEKTEARIETLKENLINGSMPKYIYSKFALNKSDSGIEIVGANIILRGKSINNFLENCNEIILMAATLGLESERYLVYAQKVSLSDGVLTDAIANAYIEEICDSVQFEISQHYNINGRFSCGYGDLPLDIQPDILKALNTQKAIGLYCNENNIMLPRKSVTAIMGIKL